MLKPTGWWLAVAPMDLRCGVDRLLLKIDTELGRDPRDGGAYLFRNRAGTRLKMVCVDAQGVWLCTRVCTRVRSTGPAGTTRCGR